MIVPYHRHKQDYVYIYLDTRKPGKFKYIIDNKKVIFEYEPFYVGKGHNYRATQHINNAKKFINDKKKNHKVSLHFMNKLKKILKEGYKPKIKRFYCKDEDFAYDLENMFVSAIGRKDLKLGPLTNWSDGGRGGTKTLSEKQKKKRKGKKMSEKTYKALHSARIRFWKNVSEEDKKAIIEKMKATKKANGPRREFTDEEKKTISKKISKGLLGRPVSESTRQKLREFNQKYKDLKFYALYRHNTLILVKDIYKWSKANNLHKNFLLGCLNRTGTSLRIYKYWFFAPYTKNIDLKKLVKERNKCINRHRELYTLKVS